MRYPHSQNGGLMVKARSVSVEVQLPSANDQSCPRKEEKRSVWEYNASFARW